MEQTIFQYLETVRGITVQAMSNIPEDRSDIVPNGFKNNIRWNLGHVAYIQEKLSYGILNERMSIPETYEQLFANRTKPVDWTITPPSFSELSLVLTEQTSRIRDSHQGRLLEALPSPYTNSAGITFSTIGEVLLFSCYHEGLHMEAIKKIYQFIKMN